MNAFHSDPAIKEKYLARVRAHRAADEIVKGKYWQNGKGCAVGCTIHSGNHAAYERELGIPEWLARLEDRIFEGLPDKRSMQWPEQFLEAINPGADLEKIKAPFLIFVLGSVLDKFDQKKFPNVKIAIDRVIELYRSNETDLTKFEAAAEAAEAAEAAWAAEAAAWAAEAAAWAAARAAARAAEYEKFGDKLLELLGTQKK